MCLTTLIFLVSCIQWPSSVTSLKPFYDVDQAEPLFRRFVAVYEKKYSSKLEEQMRFNYFKNTLREINFLNSANRDAVYDINEYSDVSKDEFALIRTGFKPDHGRQSDLDESPCTMFYDTNITTKLAPPVFDWRDRNKVTKVRNQGKCGSCWAFSLIGNIESQYAILTNLLYQFSTQQLVDCDFSSEGCSGGDNVDSARTLISYGGVEFESDYPYEAHNQNCTFDRSKIRAKVVACKNFDLKDEEKLKEALYLTGPLSIVLDALTLHSYSGGIIDYCPQHEENHAVLLVGYGTDNGKDFWVVKNSWGEKFGEKGFFRLQRGINACGLVNDKIVSAVISV